MRGVGRAGPVENEDILLAIKLRRYRLESGCSYVLSRSESAIYCDGSG